MTYDVIHQPGQQRFVIQLPEGEAILAYRLTSPVVPAPGAALPQVDFYSTYVPEALRGKGLAEQLVRTGLRWAKYQGFGITASCWYVAKFLR